MWLPSGESATAGRSVRASRSPGGRENTERLTGAGSAGGEGFRFQTARPVTTATNNNVPTLRSTSRRPNVLMPFAGVLGADVTCEPLSAIHFNSSHTSLAACHLFSRSLARHFLTARSRIGGVIGSTEDMGGGSSCMIAEITLA